MFSVATTTPVNAAEYSDSKIASLSPDDLHKLFPEQELGEVRRAIFKVISSKVNPLVTELLTPYMFKQMETCHCSL